MTRKRPMFRIVTIVLLLSILFFAHISISDAAQENKSDQATAVILRDMRPSSFINKATGKADGFGVEVMNAVAKRAGLKITYLPVGSWKEVEDALGNGEADLCPVFSITEARQKYVSFTESIETFGITINVRARSRDILGLNDLKGRNVAVIRASQAYELLKGNREIRLIEYDSFEPGMFNLLAGRVDAFVIPDYIIRGLAREAGIEDDIRVLSPSLIEIKRAIAVRKDRPLLYEQVSKAVHDFILSDEYREFYVKWFGKPKPYWSATRVGTIMGALLFLILIAMAFWRHNSVVRFNRRLQQNIIELKRAEETIKHERGRFQTLVENAPFGMVIIDEKGRFTYLNKRFEDLFGYDLTDIPDGRTWFRSAYPDPEYRHTIIAEWLNNFGKGKPGTAILRVFNATSKDGTAKEAAFTSVQLSSGEFLICCEDITQLKLSQEALRESEAKYRSVVDSSLVGFCIIQDDTFKFVNKRFCEIYGYSAEELIDKMHLLDPIHPDDKKMVEESVRKRLSGEVKHLEHEFKAIRKDGQVITVKVFGTSIIYNGRPATTGSVIDITREKMLESQFLQAQKMEAIGVLAGGIAHDFNNILMSILGYTSFLLMDTNLHDEKYEKLKIIEKQVQDGADLTKQLLGFARGGRYEIKTTDLNGMLTRSADMFGRTKKEISIFRKLEEGLWTVDVDRVQIEQVFLNLFVNAWQAMPGGGELYIETRNVVPDEAYLHLRSLKPGKYVKVSITDSGIGMDEATKQKVFEPFFTTKEMGRGTGLGLASAYGIIKNHGGSINVYSEKGEGTTFTIYLPASEKVVIEEQRMLGQVQKGVETILLVDDQEVVLGVGKEMLQKLGYTVLPAQSGVEAIEMYKKNKEKIALVILDMIMPGISGGETFNALKEIEPDIKVILSSGYSINGQASKILESGCLGFIQKPFSMMELSKKIREVLD